MIHNLSEIVEFKKQRQEFILEKINDFQIAFILFQNEYTSENKLSLKNQMRGCEKISQIEGFIEQTKKMVLQEEILALQTVASIKQMLEYMETMLTSLKKLYQVKHSINSQNAEEMRGRRFSKKASLILVQWLCQHFEYPYPSLEEQIQLSQKCQLSFKQVQSWFINSRGKIIQKTYNERKFKNLVKEKFLSKAQN